MISLGCDAGAIATKAVLLSDMSVVAHAIASNEGRLDQALNESVARVLEEAGLTIGDVACIGGTGWGERFIPFDHYSSSYISCLARAANWACPEARVVVDIGGLSTTVISINELGNVLEYRANDRCASGTGFFLDLAAQVLEMKAEDLGRQALLATKNVRISAQCAVFAESEIVSHIYNGEEVANIVGGIASSIGSSVATMIRRVGLEKEVVVTGGVAKNEAVIRALEANLAVKTRAIELDPQVLGAVGAALIARQKSYLQTEKP